jgi:putative acetyltransferase
MKFRRAEVGDLENILSLFRANVLANTDYSEEQRQIWAASTDNKAMWLNKIRGEYFLLAHKDTKLVGFSSLGPMDYVDLIFVQKDEFGKGIARQLLENMETEAKLNDLSQLYADVSVSGRSFFEKSGYHVVKTNRSIRKGVYLKNFRMKKVF